MASEVKNEEWRGKVGKMSEQEFAAFLSGIPFCRIGCVDEEGWPYVAVPATLATGRVKSSLGFITVKLGLASIRTAIILSPSR